MKRTNTLMSRLFVTLMLVLATGFCYAQSADAPTQEELKKFYNPYWSRPALTEDFKKAIEESKNYPETVKEGEYQWTPDKSLPNPFVGTLKNQYNTLEFIFKECKATKLDLSLWDTSNVTNMEQMFMDCSELKTLIFSNAFNTARVTNMINMFKGCKKLETVDLSTFETSQVSDMSCMFYGCEELKTIKFSNKFNTSNVTKMLSMFRDCKKMQQIELSSFNTSSVTDMWSMFYRCSSLTELDLSSFDMSKVSDVRNMLDSDAGDTPLSRLVLPPGMPNIKISRKGSIKQILVPAGCTTDYREHGIIPTNCENVAEYINERLTKDYEVPGQRE